MTERELFEIMKKEYPPSGKVAFMLGQEHWCHNSKDGEYINYRLSMIPGGEKDCHIISTKIGWQELYNDYLRWKEELDA